MKKLIFLALLGVPLCANAQSSPMFGGGSSFNGGTITNQLTETSTLTVSGNAFSVGGSTFSIAGSSIGIRTASPSYALQNAADTYTQGEEIVGGTMTVKGNAFSVGASTFAIAGSSIGIRTTSPVYALQNAADTYLQGQEIVGGTVTVVGNSFSIGGSTFSVNGGTMSLTGANGTTTLIGGKIGGPQYPLRTIAQVNTLAPDWVGQHITVTNMTSTIFFPGGYSDCIATGTAAAQWAVVGGTHGVAMNGCGSGQ